MKERELLTAWTELLGLAGVKVAWRQEECELHESSAPNLDVRESSTKPPDIAGLTRREQEVLAWLWAGKSAPETAIILGLSTRSVEKHRQNLYNKADGRPALLNQEKL
jgi:DNA-binding CsgD family transcriptional regulator